eukprot:TRINITY_DN67534_c0_g1_i1.p1 TRINITY_DN67534_c0_g1~~TRINITY_DN67534_c0_g1_i1.p1  ORF type:complete len:377 (-),score=63.89 TRINITY_DN67534_c0_g1_i1:216-1346(-)
MVSDGMAGTKPEDHDGTACPVLDVSFCIGIPNHLQPVNFCFSLDAPNAQLKLLRAIGVVMDAADCQQEDYQVLESFMAQVRKLATTWSEVKPLKPSRGLRDSAGKLLALRSQLPEVSRTEGDLPASSRGLCGSSSELPSLCSRGPDVPRTEGDLPSLEAEIQARKAKSTAHSFRPSHRCVQAGEHKASSSLTLNDLLAREREDLDEQLQETFADQLSSSQSESDSNDDAVVQRPTRCSPMDFRQALQGQDASKLRRRKRPEFGGRRLHYATLSKTAGMLVKPVEEESFDFEEDEASRSSPPPSDKALQPASAVTRGGGEEATFPLTQSAPVHAFRQGLAASVEANPRSRGRRGLLRNLISSQMVGELEILSPEFDD